MEGHPSLKHQVPYLDPRLFRYKPRNMTTKSSDGDIIINLIWNEPHCPLSTPNKLTLKQENIIIHVAARDNT